ncbi:hypothetical protein RDWZM_007987 [Blomia tropicalis]|uniref:Sulfatase N-terminal domain-containing protein n=1 Tax=Blomia tropicalis TaxID=40697 RepID=A0A9Q0M3N6_BLOTA|nr:hypothetical protein RDWZM_007987 [Blomia tropicalis]
MLMDDMGWGDLGINGDPSHETFHLDQMAREGLLLTDFYAPSPLCSPSRASFLTGRLPIRNGFYTNNTKARNSYVPQEVVGGIAKSEILISELLSSIENKNKIVGKWHLGHSKPEYLPLNNGFHEFFGSTNYNGPALTSAPDAGSNGPLLCGKQTTFEGGFREPAIAWWPGRIKPGTTSGQVTNMMDLYRTIANLAQAPMPSNRFYDSNDLSPLLFHNEPIKNASVFYYRGDTLMAIRHGPYKAHYWTFTNPWEEFKKKIDYCPGNEVQNVTTHKLTHHQSPVLFHLIRDPGERFPIPIHRYEYTNAIKKLETIKIEHERTMVRGEPVLNICDRAAMLWSPPGCEKIDMCLPVPKSAPYDCIWPH